MPSEPEGKREMRDLWQSQKGEGFPMSVDTIRLKAATYGRKIGWRNAREFVAAFVVVVFFGFNFSRTTDLLARVGFGLIIAGTLYVAWHLYKHGSWSRLPENLGLSSCVQFHRAELVRQRNLLRGVWRWYLGPLIPGLVVLMVAAARTNPGHLKNFGWFLSGYGAFIALVFLFVWWLNQRAARRLQQRIDELDRETDPADGG